MPWCAPRVAMPDETVIDSESIALDEEGKPSFNILQNYGSSGASVHFNVFDVIILAGRDGWVSRLAQPIAF